MPSAPRRPPGSKFHQQRMDSWQPLITPCNIITIFIAAGIIFLPIGASIFQLSSSIYEQKIVYDGKSPDVQCSIERQNEGKICTVSFTFTEDVVGPVLVYYELNNFYQNHRRYVNSFSYLQLMGSRTGVNDAAIRGACYPKAMNGTLTLNPCGLIANSFFTDIITLQSSSVPNTIMDETMLTSDSEKGKKFEQVNGFDFRIASSKNITCAEVGLPPDCKYYYDKKNEKSYLYYYPNDDSVQYLHESYPKQVSPIDGVTDEHFIVWMRTAALPKFRKLYGRLHENFKIGDTITFLIDTNYEVRSFNGHKSLVISTVNTLGGKNKSLGIAYITIGCVSIFLGTLFALKNRSQNRKFGDPSLIKWK